MANSSSQIRPKAWKPFFSPSLLSHTPYPTHQHSPLASSSKILLKFILGERRQALNGNVLCPDLNICAYVSQNATKCITLCLFYYVLCLNKLYLYVHINHILLIYLSMDDLGCFHVLLIVKMLLWTQVHKYHFKISLSILLGLYHKVELLGHMIIIYLFFFEEEK